MEKSIDNELFRQEIETCNDTHENLLNDLNDGYNYGVGRDCRKMCKSLGLRGAEKRECKRKCKQNNGSIDDVSLLQQKNNNNDTSSNQIKNDNLGSDNKQVNSKEDLPNTNNNTMLIIGGVLLLSTILGIGIFITKRRK